jgi:hypothetical protein
VGGDRGLDLKAGFRGDLNVARARAADREEAQLSAPGYLEDLDFGALTPFGVSSRPFRASIPPGKKSSAGLSAYVML